MNNNWTTIANFLFVVPYAMLIMMSLPLPKVLAAPIKKFVNSLLNNFIFPEFLGGLNVYKIITLFSLFLFLESAWQSVNASDRLDHSTTDYDEHQARTIKWRYERNFWVSLFTLTNWIFLFRFHQIDHELEEAKNEVKNRQTLQELATKQHAH
jgi:hypothetical protein